MLNIRCILHKLLSVVNKLQFDANLCNLIITATDRSVECTHLNSKNFLNPKPTPATPLYDVFISTSVQKVEAKTFSISIVHVLRGELLKNVAVWHTVCANNTRPERSRCYVA